MISTLIDRIRNLFRPSTSEQNLAYIERVFDLRIRDKQLVDLVGVHRSSAKQENNERLEFLGDAVLDLIISEHLYEQRPRADEGHLTRLRSKMVNRSFLTDLALQLKMHEEYEFQKQKDLATELIVGNAFEALVGAIYLDRGYEITRDRILGLLRDRVRLEELEERLNDPKSRLLQWSQLERRKLEFRSEDIGSSEDLRFRSTIVLDGDEVAIGWGRNKKNAEMDAARSYLDKVDKEVKDG